MMQDASIDELFSGGAEEPAVRPPSKSRTVVIRTVLVSGCLTGLLWAALRIGGLATPIPFLFLIAFAVVLLLTFASGVRPPRPPRTAGRHVNTDDLAADGLLHVVKRWQNRLDWCHADAAAFNRKIQPQLLELVDERLRQRHGVVRTREPQLAARIVGEPLTTFLTTPVRRPPSPRELALLIDQMEKI